MLLCDKQSISDYQMSDSEKSSLAAGIDIKTKTDKQKGHWDNKRVIKRV
jgi:hypothetical protein